MAENEISYVQYATHPSADGPVDLQAKIFRPTDATGPLPLLIWFHSGAFHAGTIENMNHDRMAMRFTDRGIACAFVQYRLRANPEDLSEASQKLLPALKADADHNMPEIRPNMVGARAIAALEDGAAFLNWIDKNKEEQNFSGRYILGGSSAGGLTVLNLLNVAPHLGIKLPSISSAILMSGGFAYPSFTSQCDTPVLALHGSRDHQIPVTPIRHYASDPKNNCTLLEDLDHGHGDLRNDKQEPLWQAVERIIKFDKGDRPASARTAAVGTPVKDEHKFCLYTCVKNEGPFLLEWIAHNRAIGVTDFIIFSNDCTDGTHELLEHLDKLGIVNHIPNPSMRLKSREHLKITIANAPFHRAFFRADYVILSDVDEFIQINVKGGTLNDLVAASGYPDVLSLTELLYGFGGVSRYSDDLVCDQFRVANTIDPEEGKARRGIKSIMKVSPLISAYTNHRPMVKPENADKVLWMTGAGSALRPRAINKAARGHDARGTYRLGRVNHYTLRSGESMMVKFERGDAVRPARMREEYFSERNGSDCIDNGIDPHLPGLRAELAELLKDPETKRLHEESVEKHREMIKIIGAKKNMKQVWQAIQEEVAISEIPLKEAQIPVEAAE